MRFVRGHVELPLERRDGVAGQSRNIEVNRAWRAGRRLAERLAHKVLHLVQGFDLGVELGHRRIERRVLHLLVRIAMLELRHMPPGDGDHGPIRICDLGAEGGGKARAQRALVARRNERARFVNRKAVPGRKAEL